LTSIIPDQLTLDQNFPNPFNPATVINYEVPVDGNVQMRVFDVLGQEVAMLVDQAKSAGTHSVVWNAEGMPSGTYFCRLLVDAASITKPMMLLR
jgi:hypothetical protein